MAANAGSKKTTAASMIRQFDVSAELRATAERRKRPAESAPQAVGFSWSREGIPEIAKRLSALFPDLDLDVVNEVLSQRFRANPNCSRQQLASDATAKLLEMSVTNSGPQSVTSFEPAQTSMNDAEQNGRYDESLQVSKATESKMAGDGADPTVSDVDAFFLDEQMAALLALDQLTLHRCVKTLVSVLQRIEEKPTDVRVRRLRRGNAKFHAEVGRHGPALELLLLAGFVEEGDADGDPTLVFHGCPHTSTAFLSTREALEGILEAFQDSSSLASPATPAVEPLARPSQPKDARLHIAEITEQRLRDPRSFREAARARGLGNSASGTGYMLKKTETSPPALPGRRAQHFTLADVEKMRVADEIANTPSFAEEYRRTRQNVPVRNLRRLQLGNTIQSCWAGSQLI